MAKYDNTTRAQVIAGYALGMSKSALAKKYKVARTTVIAWIATSEPPVPTVSDASQRDHLGQLVYEYLVTGFEALIAQNRLAADRAYLEGAHPALVPVYNAIHAGVVAVAQAIERGEQPGQPDGAGRELASGELLPPGVPAQPEAGGVSQP